MAHKRNSENSSAYGPGKNVYDATDESQENGVGRLIGKVKLFVSNHAADQQPNSNLPGCPCSFFILKCLNLKANNCRVFAFDVSLLSYPQLLPAKLIKFIFRNIICVDDLHMHQPVILKIKSKQIVPLDHICQLTPFHDPLSR